MLNYILPFIILILIVVFIHEYGHYYFAKKFGVGVTDFSIGFGKEIFGWNDKSGTRWKICWIPLGGYVKFFGDRNVYSQADHKEILEKYSEEDQKKLFTLIRLSLLIPYLYLLNDTLNDNKSNDNKSNDNKSNENNFNILFFLSLTSIIITSLSEQISPIENNHLMHIQKAIDRLNKIAWVVGLKAWGFIWY